MLISNKLMRVKIIGTRFSSFKVLDGEISDCENVMKKQSVSITKVMNTLVSFIKQGGGKKSTELHTAVRKKLLARQRVKLLLDADSPFLEIGTFAGISMDYGNIPAAGIVAGIGKIHDRYCIIGANDATVKGGVFFPITVTKQARVQHISRLNQLPCIYLVDSGGAFLPMQAEIFPDAEHGGRSFYNEAVFSANGIPQISVVCGSSTAGGAYCPTMTEEAIIVNKSGIIFLGGPPLVKAATGEIVSEQELGGADLHCRVSGCTDYFANSEEEAFDMCRESVLALNIPPINTCSAEIKEPLYPVNELDILAAKECLQRDDIYKVLARIFDGSEFKEFKKEFGRSLICGFSYICGNIVGVLANCGFIYCQDAQKGAHFIELCEKRQIPLVFLQNSVKEELPEDLSVYGNILKDRAKLVAAHCSAHIPKVVINIGGCFEDENFVMGGMSFDCNFMFSWPSAHCSSENVIPQNPKYEELSENFELCLNLFYNTTSAFYRASRMLIDDIILPSHTRKVLALCISIATNKTSHVSLSQERSSAVFRM